MFESTVAQVYANVDLVFSIPQKPNADVGG